MSVTKALSKVTSPKFELGQIVMTQGAMLLAYEKELALNTFLVRHVNADWGDLCDEDKKRNDEALEQGHRIFSSYNISDTEKLWVVTERDRSVTTFLLPSEY